MHTKPSVICTHCTPLNTLSSGPTPGASRQSKGKIQKFTAQMRHTCTISSLHPPGKLSQAREQEKNSKFLWCRCTTLTPYLAASPPRSHTPASLPPLHQ